MEEIIIIIMGHLWVPMGAGLFEAIEGFLTSYGLSHYHHN
jgi:hypothetical protein